MLFAFILLTYFTVNISAIHQQVCTLQICSIPLRNTVISGLHFTQPGSFIERDAGNLQMTKVGLTELTNRQKIDYHIRLWYLGILQLFLKCL